MTETTNPCPSLKERILASIKEAHARDREYIDTHFSLGSAAQHCDRLSSYLSLEAKAAARLGFLTIFMPSEYHAPSYQVTKDLDTINMEQLEAAIIQIKDLEAKLEAMRQKQLAEANWYFLNQPSEGKFVRVVAGRKVKKGTVGKIKRMWDNPYEKFNQHVAIGTPDGLTHYTYAENCKVILPIVEEPQS